MKKTTKMKISMSVLLALFYLGSEAQNAPDQRSKISITEIKDRPNEGNKESIIKAPFQSGKLTQAAISTNETAGNKVASTSCTDKINYVGNNATNVLKLGGVNSSSGYFSGAYQAFPNYAGNLLAVEFDASKMTPSGNAVSSMSIYVTPLAPGGGVIWTQTYGPFVQVTINSSALATYTATFPSPIPLTNGFGIGFVYFTTSTVSTGPVDSVYIAAGPNTTGGYHSFFTKNTSASIYTVGTYFNPPVDLNFMFRPIVTTSANASWSSARTSTGCGVPAVYGFTNTSPAPSSYVTNTLISPSGLTNSLDYGDGSPLINYTNSAVSHSYTTFGNYVANFTQTYVGWTDNCADSKTFAVVVDNPLPSFSYTISGLTVTFNNTSQNMSNYVWNFGDLSTSSQDQPGTHTFGSPGTYVIELEGTAPCGKVHVSVSVTVPSNGTSETGIFQYSANSAKLSLFPNPAGNFLQLEYDGTTDPNSKIEIYNSFGATLRVIKSDVGNENYKIDISDLSKGIYFIKIKTSEGDVVKSFIKE